MERIIQPFDGPAPGLLAHPSPHHLPTHPAPAALTSVTAKAGGDYLRALRRRAWVVLAVGLIVGVSGAAVVVRLPNTFRAVARIMIEPPRADAALGAILPIGDVARLPVNVLEKYVPNRLTLLKSRDTAERVLADPAIGSLGGNSADPAQDLVAHLSVRNQPQSTVYDVALEGADPARVTRAVNKLVESFAQKVNEDQAGSLVRSKSYARKSIAALNKSLTEIDEQVSDLLKKESIFAPGGRNILEDRYVSLTTLITNKKIRHENLQHEAQLARLFPGAKGEAPLTAREKKIAELMTEKKRLDRRLSRYRSSVSTGNADPAVRATLRELADVVADVEALQAQAPRAGRGDPFRTLLSISNEEITRLDQESLGLLGQLQESMPAYQKFVTLEKLRDQKSSEIAELEKRLGTFEMLSETQDKPVIIQLRAIEPTSPVSPNRPLLIGLISAVGLALGAGLVCLFEHVDHSVKMPEHLTAGLGLPIFGVVPRMRRLARNHRGGHLWTPGEPLSIEADAYRNLRASLLGLQGAGGPLVTLMVTSAKAGEGKSTTSLNLAATCARAGERTLLVDVDLRRASLLEVFDPGGFYHTGLVNVLKGDMPWQRVVVRTDVPNLDFLPTGETADIPIEVLGTLEMRQLLAALAGQYDRVILDAPAVLGLADCRMLGRMVDAALLVVRSGAHDLRPLRHAKGMLEQSKVPIAGVVFNGLIEDYHNWSSYGPGSYPASGTAPTRPDAPTPGLDAPPTATATAPAAAAEAR